MRESATKAIPLLAALFVLGLLLGNTPALVRAAPASAVSLATGATYHTLTPYRVLDSRSSTGGTLFHSQVKQTVLVANGVSGVPTTATAVTGNVTIVGQTAGGFVTVAPALTSGVQPGTSTLNVPVGDIRANGVTVPLAAGGNLDFMYWVSSTGPTADVLFDVTGYFGADTSGATYHSLTPYRVLDSRISLGAGLFHSQMKQTVLVANGVSGVPATAVAVTGNVTIINQTAGGYVSVAPSLTSGVQPGTSAINFPTGDIRANGVTVPLAAGGNLDFMYWVSSTGPTANVIFDVTGYFSNDASGATYHSLTPYRVLDSRSSTGGSLFRSQVKQTVLMATGASGVPTTADAVTGNVTIVNQTSGGYLTAAPALTSGVQPDTSTINFPVGDIRANGVTVPLAAGGNLDFMYWVSSTGPTSDVLFDVTGYFSGGSAGVAVPNFSHVYVIIFENKEYSDIVGSSSAPYINSLIARYGLATNFYAETHPSEPNYIALTSGGTQGVTGDGDYNLSVNDLFDQVSASGRTWHAYQQGYPGGCFTGSSSAAVTDGVGLSGAYARKHNPAISYTSISGNAAKCANITDLASFNPAAASFEFIAPNMINDMHDGTIADGDNFLKAFLPKITSSSAFANSVVFVTFDEGTTNVGGGGHIATLAITPHMTPGFKAPTTYRHYSMLRTIEQAWGLPYLGSAGSADVMAFPY